MIIAFKIENGRGIVRAEGELDGRSAHVRGKNGAGKSSLIDLFWWGLGGELPCKLPIPGLVLEGGAAKLDQGGGAVAVEDLSDGERIKLDIAIGAALGHRMIPVRHASLLDAAARAEIERVGEQHGVQLFFEEVTSGELEITIIEEEL